ncbi:DUF362 domain-containing protein [Candidatus Aminicenantes bacterium AH-873-B07]|nr:DUF362 domain-containing protein [Candidatus Aminicenantes bacterium AH-873-B07]
MYNLFMKSFNIKRKNSKSEVAIVKVKNGQVKKALIRALELIGGLPEELNPGKKVLVKPNFIRSEPPSTGTTTDFRLIRAVIEILREKGVEDIIVGEASGNQYDTEEIYQFLNVRNWFPDVEIADLDRDEIINVQIEEAKALKEVGIARRALEADFIISLPILKTHNSTLITLGMKNMMGVLPQREKWKMHLSGLHKALVDLNRIVKPDLVIIDGIIGQEGLGPTMGKPVEMNLLIAGYDVVAVDSVGSAIMDIPPSKIKHLVYAEKEGIGISNLEEIKVLGEKIENVRRHFKRPFGKIFFYLTGIIQYKIGVFLLDRFNYDIRPFLKDFASFHLPKPKLRKKLCKGFKKCIEVCPENAIQFNKNYPKIDYKKCNGCMACYEQCPEQAFRISRFPKWWLRLIT